MDPCEKDNFIKLTTTGTGTFDEGATKCDPTDPQTEPFNWNFTNNEATLHITDGTDSIDQTVAELTASKLVLTMSGTDNSTGMPITYTVTTTYEAK
jgi:hypothetical protein